MQLTHGKIRALSTTASTNGTFKVLAVDHRDSMRVLIDPDNPHGVPTQTLVDIKLNLLREVAPSATAVMLEPEYSVAQSIVSHALPGQVGFLCALEAQGYSGEATARETNLLNGWTVEKAKRIGASAIKLLVYYHPDAGHATEIQETTIRGVIKDCQRYDIPLFLEPLYYKLADNTRDFNRRKVVIDTVKRLSALHPDVLKIQFPDDTANVDRARWLDACSELDEASSVPWALLSGGDPFDSFKLQVEMACRAGCSGFMVGRAIWREIIAAPGAEKSQIARNIVLPRFIELGAIVDNYGHSLWRKHQLPAMDEWDYTQY